MLMLTRFMRVPAAGNDLVEMVRPLWCISYLSKERTSFGGGTLVEYDETTYGFVNV
jgi:hypothetical protein